MNSTVQVPYPQNEPILSYAPGTAEKEAVLVAYKKMFQEVIEVPLEINGKQIKTGDTAPMSPRTIINTYWAITTKRLQNM